MNDANLIRHLVEAQDDLDKAMQATSNENWFKEIMSIRQQITDLQNKVFNDRHSA